MESMRIKVYLQRCISSGNCVLAAPRLFAQDDEGLVVAQVPNPRPCDYQDARKAAAACPVAAIALEEDEENDNDGSRGNSCT
jgi:ferredoxin